MNAGLIIQSWIYPARIVVFMAIFRFSFARLEPLGNAVGKQLAEARQGAQKAFSRPPLVFPSVRRANPLWAARRSNAA
jgi:hypothetical protein